jgi:hypothetical protein
MDPRRKRLLYGVATLVGAVIFTFAGYLLPRVNTAMTVFKVEQAKATNATPEPPPLIPDGVKDWQGVLNWMEFADSGKKTAKVAPGYTQFFEQQTGYSKEDVREFARLQKDGQKLTVTLYAGTHITNTGYDPKSGKYKIYSNFRLKQDREILVAPSGYVPLKLRPRGAISLIYNSLAPALAFAGGEGVKGASKHCGNAVVFSQQEVQRLQAERQKKKQEKKPEEKPCGPINKTPGTTPLHPGNPSTDRPHDNPPQLVEDTPCYKKGNAEEVTQDQQPGTHGTYDSTPHGTDSGGTAPGSVGEGGEVTPPPTNEPEQSDSSGGTSNDSPAKPD